MWRWNLFVGWNFSYKLNVEFHILFNFILKTYIVCVYRYNCMISVTFSSEITYFIAIFFYKRAYMLKKIWDPENYVKIDKKRKKR